MERISRKKRRGGIHTNRMKGTSIPIIFDCNDNCISCPVPRRGTRPNPGINEIKTDIDEIAKSSNHIEFTGGETTLNPDLIKILKHCGGKNFQEIGLLTNCKKFYYKNYVKPFSRIKNLKVITTLYGSSAKIQDTITRTPNSFTHKIGGIKNLLEIGVNIELRILLHKMNYLDLENISKMIIEKFPSRNITKIVIMNPKLTFNAWQNKEKITMKISELAKFLKNPIKELFKHGYNVQLYHFPHCILEKEIRNYSVGKTSQEPEIKFPKKCQNCIYRKNCSGIWASYLAFIGNDEFKNIKQQNA